MRPDMSCVKLVPFCRPKMKAVIKSMAIAWFSPSTSRDFCSVAADSRSGKMREKIIVWEILCISGEDCR